MHFKFGSHPKPGFYDEEGRFITTGNTHKSIGEVSKKSIVTANTDIGFGGGGGLGGTAANTDRYNPIKDRLEEGSVVEDWIPRDHSGLNDMFRLMYHRDPIVGSIVDILAELIWSEFDLIGIDDPEIKKVYQDAMQALDPLTFLPSITREFLVLGRSVSSMIYNDKKGNFTDIICHDPSFLRLTPIPIRGYDPKVDMLVSPALAQFASSSDPRDLDARKGLPDVYLKAIQNAGVSNKNQQSHMGGRGNVAFEQGLGGEGVPLDPLTTLFVPRQAFNYDYIGTSFLTRTISFWALEKALINATVTSARRRSRSILHVKMGIENLWEPTSEELNNTAGLFISADEDPVGAVVATRNGVEVGEVRSGTDFYKWSDEWELLTQGKLRALGANDALLSGDATYNNQDSAKTFFMDRANALRKNLTAKMFYRKIFPTIARLNGFVKRSPNEIKHGIRTNKMTQREALSIPDTELILPKITWRQDLVNDIDEVKLEMYEKMEEKGLPITLKNWAQAANLDLDKQIEELDNDAVLRKKVNEWKATFEFGEGEIPDIEAAAQAEFVRSLQSITSAGVKEVVGSIEKAKHLGPISNYLFWDKKGNLGPLNVKVLAEFLETIDPNTNSVKILYDFYGLRHQLLRHFESEAKAQIAHYLLYRTELTPVKPALDIDVQKTLKENIEASLDKYKTHGSVYKLAKIAETEFKIINALSRKNKDEALNRVQNTANSIKTSAKDPIPGTSVNLYSGVSKI